ncbi:MAG TPA: S8 family peptidase [Actinomycetota bacterium]|nr:S8 family peptidase [Actinomycetota bacterium]
MRRSLIPAALSALLLTSLFVPPSGAADRGKTSARSALRPVKMGYQARGAFVPGEVLVKFRSGVSRGVERATHAAVGARVLARIAGGLGIDHVRLPRGLTVAEAVRAYSASPLVEYAEPNYYRYPTFTPNDTSYNSLWALNNTGQEHPIADPLPPTASGTSGADMDVTEAWDLEKGDPNVVIAVLDSGVDVGHEDLGGNIWQNPLEAGGTPLVDDDANGYVDDINGRDTAEDDNTLLEANPVIAGREHGTHVAGTIAAVTNNATGVSGVCGGDAGAAPDPLPGCKIMVLKFMEPIDTDEDFVPDTMAGELSAELEAILYARTMGADIINASFGGPSWTNSEREAIRLAGVNNDILFVAAAANDSLDNDVAVCFGPTCSPAYPASYNLSRIVTVAASNHNDEYGYFTGCQLAGFSKPECAFTNFGRYSVDVAAPGVDILSTTPSNTYSTFDGTSMAAPHTAGVAGLLLSQDATRTALSLKNIIMATADTTKDDGVTPLDLNTSMNTLLFTTKRTGKFTRTSARVNANDAVDFVGTPPNGSASHDGDIPGAKGLKAKVSGSLAWPGDVNDVFKKKLSKGKTYRVTLVVPNGRDFDLYLLKSDTKEIWQPGKLIKGSFKGPGGDETFSYKPGATRTFFIHVTWFFGGNGSYTLKVACIKNC